MPQANPWSLGLDPELVRHLASTGAQALASGQISPEEAQGHLADLTGGSSQLPEQPPMSSVGLPSSPLAIGQNPNAKGPMDMTAGGVQAGNTLRAIGNIGKALGAKASVENKDTETEKRTGTQFTTKGPDQAKAESLMAQGIYPKIVGKDASGLPQYDFSQLETDPNNPIQQQKSALDQMREMVGQRFAPENRHSDINLAPLAALADYENGRNGNKTNLAAAAEAQRPQSNAQAYSSAMDELLKRQGDLAKEVTANERNLKSGTLQDQLTQTQIQNLQAQQGNGGSGGSAGGARLFNAISKAGLDFDNDKLISAAKNTINTLNRASSILDGPTPVSAQNFALLQQDMMRALTAGGTVTEGQVDRELVKPLQAIGTQIQTKFGNVTDLRTQVPQLFTQLQSIINGIKADYAKAGLRQTTSKAVNYKRVPNEDIQATADAKVKDLQDLFQPYLNSAPTPASVSGGPKIGDIVKGHSYLGGNPNDPKSWKAQ